MATEKENIEPEFRMRTIESLSRHIEAALRFVPMINFSLIFCLGISTQQLQERNTPSTVFLNASICVTTKAMLRVFI